MANCRVSDEKFKCIVENKVVMRIENSALQEYITVEEWDTEAVLSLT